MSVERERALLRIAYNLLGEGKWKEYRAEVDRLKSVDGMKPTEAWLAAQMRYPCPAETMKAAREEARRQFREEKKKWKAEQKERWKEEIAGYKEQYGEALKIETLEMREVLDWLFANWGRQTGSFTSKPAPGLDDLLEYYRLHEEEFRKLWMEAVRGRKPAAVAVEEPDEGGGDEEIERAEADLAERWRATCPEV